jgi:hypothetical protein
VNGRVNPVNDIASGPFGVLQLIRIGRSLEEAAARRARETLLTEPDFGVPYRQMGQT